MKNDEKSQIGWRLPPSLKDKFTEFCEPSLDSMEEEAAAALLIYMHLPRKIRELAKLEAKGVELVEPRFWADFGKGLELGITAQLNTPQKKRDSRKKKP